MCACVQIRLSLERILLSRQLYFVFLPTRVRMYERMVTVNTYVCIFILAQTVRKKTFGSSYSIAYFCLVFQSCFVLYLAITLRLALTLWAFFFFPCLSFPSSVRTPYYPACINTCKY